MTIRMTGSEARLEGDWTLSGVTRNINSLALSLQQIEPGSEKKLRVDCEQMKEADVSGLQLINVWIQCVRFRGVEPVFVNVPKRLRHAMQVLVGHFVLDSYPDTTVMSVKILT